MQTRVREEMWMRPPAHGGTGIMCQASTFCGTGGRHVSLRTTSDRSVCSSVPLFQPQAPVSAPHWGPDQQEPLRAQTTWIS
ncbi:unnamed protein product [Boreogadus saida]